MFEIGAIGYAIVGVSYAILTLLLVTSWRGRRIGGYLIGACLISVVWGAVLAIDAASGVLKPFVLFAIEILRAGFWISFLVRLLADVGVSRNLRFLAQGIWLTVLVAGIGQALGFQFFGDAGDIGGVLIPGGLATALVGLVLIEQLYRNSGPEARYSLKMLVLGLGGMFAFDLFLYSQAVLFNAIDTASWIARGAVNVFFVPLIAIAARRNPDWDLKIFVSRQVVFYSTTLIAVGAYLLLMSAGGYLLLHFGGSWGAVARTVFFAGAGIVLLTLLFSSTLRARVKVFLNKHFFHNKYDYREEWLRLVSTLASFEDSSTRQVVIRAIAQIASSPAGLLWLLDEKERVYRLAASYETRDEIRDIDMTDPVVEFVQRDGWIIDLDEYRRDPETYYNLELPDWVLGIGRAWLIVPLMSRQRLLGLILLYAAPGPPRLNYEDRDLLKTVGNHIAVHLAQEKSDSLLAEAQQFETYNRLTAFLMHDLNNLIAQQSLIVSNAEKHRRNPDFVDDAMSTISNSVTRMQKLMQQLRRRDSSDHARKTNLADVVGTAVDRCKAQQPVPEVKIHADDTRLRLNSEQFVMVLSHLIRNAQDATQADGTVTVDLGEIDGSAIIRVADTGEGMSSEFIRDRLFRPFDSTKGSQGMGIGAYQAREFARRLGGDLKVESVPKEGTAVTMSLPLA